MNIEQLVVDELKRFGSPRKVEKFQYFFKTGKGQYGEGDQFLGVSVPETRSVAKLFSDIQLADVQTILHSPYHEVRLCGALILVAQFDNNKRNVEQQKIIVNFVF